VDFQVKAIVQREEEDASVCDQSIIVQAFAGIMM